MHNAVTVDGRLDWFSADVAKYYELAAFWKEDATLAGTDTILQAYPEENLIPDDDEAFEHRRVDAEDTRALLVIPDSKGRLRHILHMLWHEPYWRDIVILISDSTSQSYLTYLEKRNINYIRAGKDHVDYKKALEELNSSYGVKVVRVDSGGILNGVLLKEGLVDEVSILIHPYLIGGTSPRSIYNAADLVAAAGIVNLKLIHLEQLANDLIWIRYEIKK